MKGKHHARSMHAGEELYAQAVLRGDECIGERSAADDVLFKKVQESHNVRLSARKAMLLAKNVKYSGNHGPTGEVGTSDISVEFLVTAVLHKV